MARALINVPAKAKRGELVAIKTLVSHHMESGFRHTTTGERIPRDIV
ncbi:MAG: sulfur-oxidizing protein SoxZ, partial [Variibacter sp.]|nr:sulfur-oxidizing protein SoxZ [Variibacter sp.]